MRVELALVPSIIEMLCMLVLVIWSWRKVTAYMSLWHGGGARKTKLSDGLAVCAVGAGAMERVVYTVASWLDPAFVVQTFGPLDVVMLTVLYVGVTWWICAPMIRRRKESSAS